MELTTQKIKTYSSLVMFEHTIFALPFAYLALFLASDGWPTFSNFFWITLAMVGARNGANAWNRLTDAKIDLSNPRTANRELPSGKVKKGEVIFLTIVCFIFLVLAAFHLQPICWKLAPLAIIFICFYSYTKRFTWLCHFYLGVAVALAPLGAWIAITGKFSPGAFMLAAIHGLWVAGFDIIYATQDYHFDVKNKIHSVPARFGIENALKIALGVHMLTIVIMLALPLFFNLGWIYLLGVLLVSILLGYEHKIVSPDDLTQVKIASYSINQIISPLLLIMAIIDLI